MDHPMPLLRDSSVRAANRAEGERLRKVKEDKKRKRQQKLQARERGEDTNSDDDDDDGDDDEVVDDVEWDILENEDALTGISSSLQESGPFPFHGREGTSEEPVEVGRTVGLPLELMGAGALLPRLRCRRRRLAPSSRPKSQGERAPLPRSRGRAQNSLAPMRWSRGRGVRHPNASAARRH